MTGDGRRPIRRLFRPANVRRDVDEELRFHFESAVEALMTSGRTREEAEREARIQFGDERRYRRQLERIDQGAESQRRRREAVGTAFSTVKYALRGLVRSPGLSIGIVAAFALGIGANATMFGIVDRLLLSAPDHFTQPDEVRRIVVERSFIGRTMRSSTLSLPDIEDLEGVPQFSAVAGYSTTRTWFIGRGDAARPVRSVMTTASYWDLVGVLPVLGRFFDEAEERVGGEPVVVLGHGLWKAVWDSDPSVLGSTIDFGYGPYTVIGITPEGFTGAGLERVDLWLPLRSAGAAILGENWVTGGRDYYWVRGLARMAPEVRQAAEEAATTLHRAGLKDHIDRWFYDAEARVIAAPLIAARGLDGPPEARVALWLAGVSAIVLLIACVNVANLLLARALQQRRETAIRLALGVPRGRLLAQTLTEGVLLALAGGAAAILVTGWAGRGLRNMLLPDVAWTDRGVSGTTVFVILGLALLTGLLSAAIPAFEAVRRQVADALRTASGGIARSAHRTRNALTVAQAALSVILLVGAGLFVRSLDRVRSQDMGFDLANLLLAEPVEEDGTIDDAGRRQFFAVAADRLSTVPGVVAAGYSIGIPFWSSSVVELAIPGRDSLRTPPSGGPYVTMVSRDYFTAMDLRVTRGRAFEEGDFGGNGLVTIVNDAMTSLYWPGEDPLGSCLLIEQDDPPCTTIVGIAENASRGNIVEEPNPQFYLPMSHPAAVDAPPEAMLIRVAGIDAGIGRRIRETMMAAGPGLRFVTVRPLEDLTAGELRSWRLGATMFTIFGLLALVVAAFGLYSVLAFDVAQRTREIGLRSALGAGMPRLLRAVVGRALRMTLTGVVVGLAVAALLAPRIRDLLFETSPWDPVTLGAVAASLVLVAVLAAGLPAWRAARVDPNIALKAE